MRAPDARPLLINEEYKKLDLDSYERVEVEEIGVDVGVAVKGYPVKWQDDV